MLETFELPMVPLRDLILFPHTILPLLIGRDRSIEAIKESVQTYKNKIFLVTQRNEQDIDPEIDQLYTVGTIATVVKMIQTREKTIKVIVEGIERGQIIGLSREDGGRFLKGTIVPVNSIISDKVALRAYKGSLVKIFNEYVQFKDNIPSEIIISIKSVKDEGKLIDIVVANLDVNLKKKQSILENYDLLERINELLKLIQSEIEILKLEKKISDKVRTRIEGNRKRVFLNEQMEVIKRELGDENDYNSELSRLGGLIEEKEMPDDAREQAISELRKLKFMSPMSAEATVIKNYLEWMVQIPWVDESPELNNLREAEQILNEDHYGITDIKERILEFLAVRTLTKNPKGSILCFAGPPGVGKTSLARSIARATGRQYVKLALGGVRDEAEIRGHRRTYIGAMPGSIIQSLKRAGTCDPIFLLDEIDKLSQGVNGDPASALLEVLDPEQNVHFQDHYLNVDYDLSSVFFIATANNLQNIPMVLRDRLEIIELSGYTLREKVEIARRYLIKRARRDNGLEGYSIAFDQLAIERIAEGYTRESGVRSLERQISKILRKIARRILTEEISKNKRIRITTKSLGDYLGVPRFVPEIKEYRSLVGVASGLAWTPVGGDILKIEVMVVPGTGKIELTGQLGDVMIESAKAALTYVRSYADKYNLATDFYQKNDIHIHVPDGAIPKDGPSAGITISLALLSAFTGRAVKHDVAMTGEISLRGFVLPIGGLKEKLLAAIRGGIKLVIIPEKNRKDLTDISKEVLEGLKIHCVERVEEVWHLALEA